MKNKTYYLISIFLKPGKQEILRAYERRAVRVMEKHGGRFVRVLRPIEGTGAPAPDEIHLLAFDSEEGFARFRDDPELLPFRPARDEAVDHSNILKLADVPLADYFE